MIPPSVLSIEDLQASLKVWYSVLDKQSTRFVLITGAGISVAAGFPTFEGYRKSGIRGEMNHQKTNLHPIMFTIAHDLLNWNTVVERQSQPHLDMFMSFVAQLRRRSLRTKLPTLFHIWAQNHKHLDLWLTFNVDGLEAKQVQHRNYDMLR